MNMPTFWLRWAEIAEAADNLADKERHQKAQSDQKYQQMKNAKK